MLARRAKPPCHARPAGSAQSGMRPRVAQVRRPGGAGKGTSPALAALAEPGAPGRHAPLELSPEAEAKDPELAALLRKAGPRGRLAHSSSHRHAWLGTSALQMTWAPAQ